MPNIFRNRQRLEDVAGAALVSVTLSRGPGRAVPVLVLLSPSADSPSLACVRMCALYNILP